MLAYNFTTDCLTYNPNFDIEIHNHKFMCIQWINYVLNWLYSCDFGWGWVYPVQAVGTWHQGPDNGGGSAATGVPRKCAHTDLLLTGWVSPISYHKKQCYTRANAIHKEKMYLKFSFIMSPYMLASSDDLSSIWNGECGLRWMHTYIVIFIWSSNLLKKDNCESLTVQQVHVSNPLNFSLWLKISKCWLTSKFPDLFSVQCKTQLIILLK